MQFVIFCYSLKEQSVNIVSSLKVQCEIIKKKKKNLH